MPRARALSAATAAPPATDGRQRRSERSREAIVQALFDLIGGGTLEPTAQQVAARAGVGIRSVFRHFADMESLYVELDARLRAEAAPIVRAEPVPGSLERRARALAERRCAFFERIAPYKRAAGVQRWRSAFLARRHTTLVRELRADLVRWLPELRRAPDATVDALELVLSFEAWDRLRSDQRLGVARSRDAMASAVGAIVAPLAR